MSGLRADGPVSVVSHCYRYALREQGVSKHERAKRNKSLHTFFRSTDQISSALDSIYGKPEGLSRQCRDRFEALEVRAISCEEKLRVESTADDDEADELAGPDAAVNIRRWQAMSDSGQELALKLVDQLVEEAEHIKEIDAQLLDLCQLAASELGSYRIGMVNDLKREHELLWLVLSQRAPAEVKNAKMWPAFDNCASEAWQDLLKKVDAKVDEVKSFLGYLEDDSNQRRLTMGKMVSRIEGFAATAKAATDEDALETFSISISDLTPAC